MFQGGVHNIQSDVTNCLEVSREAHRMKIWLTSHVKTHSPSPRRGAWKCRDKLKMTTFFKFVCFFLLRRDSIILNARAHETKERNSLTTVNLVQFKHCKPQGRNTYCRDFSGEISAASHAASCFVLERPGVPGGDLLCPGCSPFIIINKIPESSNFMNDFNPYFPVPGIFQSPLLSQMKSGYTIYIHVMLRMRVWRAPAGDAGRRLQGRLSVG